MTEILGQNPACPQAKFLCFSEMVHRFTVWIKLKSTQKALSTKTAWTTTPRLTLTELFHTLRPHGAPTTPDTATHTATENCRRRGEFKMQTSLDMSTAILFGRRTLMRRKWLFPDDPSFTVSHPFLQKLHDLLDTVVHVTGVCFQHQLRGLWFFVFRINPSETCER